MSALAGGKSLPGIVNRVVREMLSELSEVPPVMVEFYSKQAAAMIYWISSGEENPDVPLPDNFPKTMKE